MTHFNRLIRFSSFLTLLFLTSPALAVQGINIQTFNPSVSDHFVYLEDGLRTEWPKEAKYYLGAHYNFSNNPFVATDFDRTKQTAVLIDHIQTFDFFFGYKPSNQFALFIGAPIHTVTYPDITPSILAPGSWPTGSQTTLGDLRLLGKIRLNQDDENTAWALVPEIHFPTGSAANFASDASTYLSLKLALERLFEAWTFGANIGIASAPNAVYGELNMAKRVFFGLGGFLPFNDEWGMSVEFFAQQPIPFSPYLNPSELYGGLRYQPQDNFVFLAGLALGKIGGIAGQNIRALAGLRYTWFKEEAPASQPVHQAAPQVALQKASPPAPVATPAPVKSAPAPAPRVVLLPKRIEVLVPINFEHDSDRLTVEAQDILSEVAIMIQKNQKSFKKILVDGHTNTIGGDAYNLKLSLARAKSVKKYLVSQGVNPQQLEARGFGQRRPKLPYSNPKAMDTNRRVEFIIVK